MSDKIKTGHIGVVGAGLVGLGWTIVFARAGEQVRVYDTDPSVRANLLDLVGKQLSDLKHYGLIEEPNAIIKRVQVRNNIEEVVKGARFIQESVLEEINIKRMVSAKIGPLLDKGAVVGSSTSGIPGSAFTELAINRDRFLVAHPVNPPYLVPVVEIVPTPWTAEEAVMEATTLMAQVGQSPVLVKKEIEGFILNRLQGVLLREAWALYEEGYASIEDIDKTVSEGLGLRWSFMGPFETIDLNAPGGVSDYAKRLGGLYYSIHQYRKNPRPWSEASINSVNQERRKSLKLNNLAERRHWRDRRLMALAAHKTSQN